MIAHYHLPGLFEFYDFYKVFLPIYKEHPDYFYPWCDIASIYGAPPNCIWSGGRIEYSDCRPEDALTLMKEYGISARLTFSNSLLKEEHLQDERCNHFCRLFSEDPDVTNGVIVHSELLADYLASTYPNLYLVSSTTKVLTDPADLTEELAKEKYQYVVPDFRLNKQLDLFRDPSFAHRQKVEFLCNEACDFNCKARKACYENVSRQNLGEDCPDFRCPSVGNSSGYRFSKAMDNPGFISVTDIEKTYLPLGFSNYKIEGRGLGSALILEFLLYYMVKPRCHIHVREAIYLDNTLDLL